MSDENADRAEQEVKILDQHVRQLMEHFDTVQIFVTRHSVDLDGTVNVNRGGGNWFARYGQVRAWMARQHADCAAGEGEEEP